MRRWMAFACGAAVLSAAAWYFGRPTVQPDASAPVVAQAAPTEAPKEPAPKMIEVVDLARAYEPVREPEPVSPGGVDPASFIEEPTAPRRIPPAFDEENPYADVIRTVQECGGSIGERIELMPRVIPPSHDPGFWGVGSGPVQNLLHFSDDPPHVQLGTTPQEAIALWLQVPQLYGFVGSAAPRVSSVAIPGATVEKLNVVPRVVPTAVIQAEEPLRYERLNGNIGP
jgi:hypothetical protein